MSHVCTQAEPYLERHHGYDAVHPDRQFMAVRADGQGNRIGLYRCLICSSRFFDVLEPEHAIERDRA